MKIQIRDCVDIYKFYKKNLPHVTYANANANEKLAYNRAVGLGLLADGGALHPRKGKRILAAFEKKLEQYKKGVSWGDYFLKHGKQCLALPNIFRGFPKTPWSRICLPHNVEYITNTEIIIAGKIIVDNRKDKALLKVDTTKEINIVMKRNLMPVSDSCVKSVCEEWDETWVEVLPHTFYWDILKNRELIWLTDRTQEIWVPVQASYLKFALKRFSQTVTFYVRDEKSFVVVKAPLTKKIPMYKNLAACIQPLESTGDFHIPDIIDAAWEGKFRDGERKLV